MSSDDPGTPEYDPFTDPYDAVGSYRRPVNFDAAAAGYVRRQGEFQNRPRPDLILLDLKLPRMHGHEVLRTLKADDDLKMIPVVVLTTSDAEQDRRKAYGLHANGYLVKPTDFGQFRQMIGAVTSYWGVWNRPASESAG